MSKLNLEQALLALLSNNQDEDIINDEPFTYKTLLLNEVCPDLNSPYYIPVVKISDLDASLFVARRISKNQLITKYSAHDKVIVGKDCIIICMQNGTKKWQGALQSVRSIITLSDKIKLVAISQIPSVFPLEDGKYQIVTGQYRYLASVYVHGLEGISQFKVYQNKPLLNHAKQLSDHIFRDDISALDKLLAFKSAKDELDTVSLVLHQIGRASLSYQTMLKVMAIPNQVYDFYIKLFKYPCIFEAYQAGLKKPLESVYTIIVDYEMFVSAHFDIVIGSSSFRSKVEQLIAKKLDNICHNFPNGSSIQIGQVTSAKVVKFLFSENVFSLDTGIDWSKLDWSDTVAVNEVTKSVMDFLENRVKNGG
ncbi:ParB/Srx family N-terminal domain-containing protein [Pseudoalteromonas luteoviolacea]|uniref:ParB/Srx family N-terminal domain-containing protein n=1 Tax=Pseudoalteromonas luteoviolacea TaxID=43657 RepID=UPI001F3B5DD7|nr:ParB/Srx family N-terminal domain-containing protein [Pseudoalteromonas luteoviolacea]MCF6437904.1 ParB/Srx family N-terminal domain-containing protein [Pseudoalteromonas luteoviolacea]